MAAASGARRLLPALRPSRLGRGNLQPHHLARARPRAALPHQPLRPDVRGSNARESGEDRSRRQSGGAERASGQSRGLHHPQRHSSRARECALHHACPHHRRHRRRLQGRGAVARQFLRRHVPWPRRLPRFRRHLGARGGAAAARQEPRRQGCAHPAQSWPAGGGRGRAARLPLALVAAARLRGAVPDPRNGRRRDRHRRGGAARGDAGRAQFRRRYDGAADVRCNGSPRACRARQHLRPGATAMTDLPFRSALELAAEIRAKRIGCRELLELYLKRVERYNGKLNAVIATTLESARQRADAADEALARGEVWGPLHGVPLTVKESYDVAGLPTTWGVPEFKNSSAARNALAVDRLLAAGAVLFGKTNVPLMLADWQSYNAIYGTTSNPWDTSRTPGGSSGGSAAALAAGLTGLEAGSDIGSSLRNPAHYCGVYAHKPSWGVVSPRGHALGGRVSATDISVIGPLARSAADLEVALAAMAGPDEVDGAGWRLELPKPRQERLADFRVAVLLSVPHAEVDRAVQAGVQSVAETLA